MSFDPSTFRNFFSDDRLEDAMDYLETHFATSEAHLRELSLLRGRYRRNETAMRGSRISRTDYEVERGKISHALYDLPAAVRTDGGVTAAATSGWMRYLISGMIAVGLLLAGRYFWSDNTPTPAITADQPVTDTPVSLPAEDVPPVVENPAPARRRQTGSESNSGSSSTPAATMPATPRPVENNPFFTSSEPRDVLVLARESGRAVDGYLTGLLAGTLSAKGLRSESNIYRPAFLEGDYYGAAVSGRLSPLLAIRSHIPASRMLLIDRSEFREVPGLNSNDPLLAGAGKTDDSYEADYHVVYIDLAAGKVLSDDRYRVRATPASGASRQRAMSAAFLEKFMAKAPF